ncbi:hypothetical protein [Bradyrhizobium genosp. P]|uniref:hypothetical protein n=1 Tax=Bradyrhizobium genosp. P TaxID=83641 RepID=UPI003CF42CEA
MSDPHTGSGAFPLSALDDRDVRLTRRTMIAGAIATTAAVASAAIDTPANAGSVSPDQPQDMVAFLLLSAALTGVSPATLEPDFGPAKPGVDMLTSVPGPDPFDVERDYLKLLYSKDAKTFEAMLQIAKDHRESAPDIIAAVNTDEATMYLGRSLVLLWYLGAWYDPANLKDAHEKANPNATDQPHKKPEQSFVQFAVASAKAYTRGVLWRIAEAHPMGYSELQFGYWSRPPADPNDPHGPIDFITADFRSK